LQFDASGSLRVNVVTGGGSNASVLVDDAAFTPAVSSVTAVGFFADEVATDSVNEGDIGAARMTLDRKQIMVLADATTDSQRLNINAAGEAEVHTNFEYAEDSVHASTDVGVFALAVRNDAGTPLAADGDYIPITTDSTGALRVTGSGSNASVIVDDAAFTPAVSSVTAVGFFADETAPDSVNEGDIGAARMTLDRKQLMVLVDATTDSQRLAIDANGSAQTRLHGSADFTSPNAPDNPIYVQAVTETVSGSEVNDYDTTATVAKDATDNHDYTVIGTTFLLKSIIVAASGAMRVQLSVGPLAGLVVKATIFTSGSKLTEQIFFDPPIEVPVTGTGTVRLARRNDDNTAMDVYSTIIGNDV